MSFYPEPLLFLFASFLASSSLGGGGQKEKERPTECQLVCESFREGDLELKSHEGQSSSINGVGGVAQGGDRCLSGEEGPQAFLSASCLLS